ncbi:MAG: DUF368 domain-containing protein, partial [Prolixibacteraceae bacterium]|nr:DUF368 domain-containing protein [Prolixibacteraceae bacterium]
MKRTLKEYLLITLKGIGMGAADVVPGVSGGTIAFITGIYKELIDSIKSINISAIKLLLKGKIKLFWKAINGTFLLSIITGIGISIFSLARLMTFLLENYPVLIWSFFFGLIVASILYIAKEIKSWKAGTIISLMLGIITAYWITVISPAEANATNWFIFLSGSIAICAMILPGISGSFILVLLGMYKFILGAVSDLNISVLSLFIFGAFIGIVVFSNLLSWLLKKYYAVTMALLTGFMTGSLNKVWPWKEAINNIGSQK